MPSIQSSTICQNSTYQKQPYLPYILSTSTNQKAQEESSLSIGAPTANHPNFEICYNPWHRSCRDIWRHARISPEMKMLLLFKIEFEATIEHCYDIQKGLE